MDTTAYNVGARWRAGLPPGVYEDIVAPAAPQDVRMDVVAFIGLCERGPVGVAVPVDSWSDMLARFGQPGGGRLLPQAVQLFFANGGRRAVIVRALDYSAAITARFRLAGVGDGAAPLELEARDPGAWGDRLQLSWRWVRGRAFHLEPVSTTRLRVVAGERPAPHALLRRTRKRPSGSAFVMEEDLAFVVEVEGEEILLASPFPALAAGESAGPIEEVRASLQAVLDGQTTRWGGLALHPAHRDAVHMRLAQDPLAWVRIAASHTDRALLPTASLLSGAAWTRGEQALRVRDGDDGAASTGRRHFFEEPDPGRILDEDHLYRAQPTPFVALHAYDDHNETEPVSLVCLPDLVHLTLRVDDESPLPVETGTAFSVCGLSAELGTPGLTLAYPLLSAGYDPAEATARQVELVQLCEFGALGAGYGRIALLDPRPGLGADDLATWHRQVASATGHAVAYAPWLQVAPAEDPTGPLLNVPPCGAAAGVIARQERQVGVHAAPANAPVVGIVRPYADPMLPEPGFLHEERVNLIRETESGPKVMGARTTSYGSEWTQLSVRRLLHFLCRQIEIDNRWAVFEPNNTALWRRLSIRVEQRLSALFRANAFAGASPASSWFVRCDASQNPPSVQDAGQVIVLVGVAPALPAEFLVFRIALQRDGGSQVEDLRG